MAQEAEDFYRNTEEFKKLLFPCSFIDLFLYSYIKTTKPITVVS